MRDATEFAQPCMQGAFDFDGSLVDVLGAEDCLYLNVHAPAGTAPNSGLPVMVHLHGGGNAFGSPYTDASAFVERGVIVVTVAYRLGVFGFIGHPALSAENGDTSGEYGLLDQVQALRWISENIASFGGDPQNLTLFGLSAGSFDTVALMVSPLTEGLITRAAVQGEVRNGLTGEFNSIQDAEVAGQEITAPAGCGDEGDIAACLRAVPADELLAMGGPLDIVPWVGGVILPRSPLEAINERALPLLVGFNREEELPFTPLLFLDEMTRRQWVQETKGLGGPSYAAHLRSLYPGAEYDSFKWAFVTMLTDLFRGCPTRRLALANADQAPTYRYLYTHTYENDPDFLGLFRASHALEEPFLWNNFDIFPGFVFGYEPTEGEALLSQRMVDYWSNFARDGDPNGPGLPAWPRYDGADERLVTLDSTIGMLRGYHAEQCAFLEQFPIPFSWFPRGQAFGLIPQY